VVNLGVERLSNEQAYNMQPTSTARAAKISLHFNPMLKNVKIYEFVTEKKNNNTLI